jgi:surfeit locus 1 family protein
VGEGQLRTARSGGTAGLALLPLIAVATGVLILCGLGVWQVQRLQWKTHLLQRIEALKTAPPEPLAVVLNRIADHVDVDFTHVVFTCRTLQTAPVARVYAVGDLGPGDRILTACPLAAGPYRSILVDRGFLPDEAAAAYRPGGGPLEGPVVGVLRAYPATPPGSRGERGRFFSRNIPAIASELHAKDPAPVFFMLESPKPPAGGPSPQPVPTDIPNNHLGYAATWFGLAFALVGVYVASLLRRPRTTP